MFKRDRKTIICDAEKCTGCEICEFVCSLTHEKVFQPYHSKIRRLRIEPIINFAITCQFCKDPPCIGSCPQKALTQDEKTGIIRIDENKCDGCGFCIKACPFGAIKMHLKKEKVIICNQCEGIEGGPQCVKLCPREALEHTTLDAYADKVSKGAVEKLLKAYVADKKK